jgi:hypothetical protein
VVHAYNPSTQETQVGESQVLGQPGLLSKILSFKKWVFQYKMHVSGFFFEKVGAPQHLVPRC